MLCTKLSRRARDGQGLWVRSTRYSHPTEGEMGSISPAGLEGKEKTVTWVILGGKGDI